MRKALSSETWKHLWVSLVLIPDPRWPLQGRLPGRAHPPHWVFITFPGGIGDPGPVFRRELPFPLHHSWSQPSSSVRTRPGCSPDFWVGGSPQSSSSAFPRAGCGAHITTNEAIKASLGCSASPESSLPRASRLRTSPPEVVLPCTKNIGCGIQGPGL